MQAATAFAAEAEAMPALNIAAQEEVAGAGMAVTERDPYSRTDNDTPSLVLTVRVMPQP